MSISHDELMQASQAVDVAAKVLRYELHTMKALLESRDPHERAVAAVVEPIFRAAIAFVQAFDSNTASARRALDKVGGP